MEGENLVIQIIKFETLLSEAEVLEVAKSRLEQFKSIPRLLQKYYVKLQEPNKYGGIYVWDSMESLKSYRESELASSIPEAYRITGNPSIEILDTLFQLRD